MNSTPCSTQNNANETYNLLEAIAKEEAVQTTFAEVLPPEITPDLLDHVTKSVEKVLRSRWLPNTIVGCRTTRDDSATSEQPINLRHALTEEAVNETVTELLKPATAKKLFAAKDNNAFIEKLAARIARRFQRKATKEQTLAELAPDNEPDNPYTGDENPSKPAPWDDISLDGRHADWKKAHAEEDKRILEIDRQRGHIEEQSHKPEHELYERVTKLIGQEAVDWMLAYCQVRRSRDLPPASPADRAKFARLKKKLKNAELKTLEENIERHVSVANR
jgi:hypothetical protein